MSHAWKSESGDPVVFTTADEKLHRCVIAGDLDACRRVLEAEQATVDVNRVKPVREAYSVVPSHCGAYLCATACFSTPETRRWRRL